MDCRDIIGQSAQRLQLISDGHAMLHVLFLDSLLKAVSSFCCLMLQRVINARGNSSARFM